MAPSAIELIEMENSSKDVLPLPLSAGNSCYPTLWVHPGLLLGCYALFPQSSSVGKGLWESACLTLKMVLSLNLSPAKTNKQ